MEVGDKVFFLWNSETSIPALVNGINEENGLILLIPHHQEAEFYGLEGSSFEFSLDDRNWWPIRKRR
tara:strand:+ start:319 stop:519 length:201 start_codon:yes stop_codon:yes gene_type:complete